MPTPEPTPTPLDPAYWDARYGEDGFAYGTEPSQFLAQVVAHLPPGGRVLVPGDGEGRNGVWLAEQGFAVTSIDMSRAGCDKVERLAATRGVAIEVVCADLLAWTWPVAAFEAVVAIYLHLPPEARVTVHERIAAALTPDGVVVVEAFTLAHPPLRAMNPSVGGPRDAALLYSLDLLDHDFAALDRLVGEEAERDLAEGHCHVGRGAVLHALYRRPLSSTAPAG